MKWRKPGDVLGREKLSSLQKELSLKKNMLTHTEGGESKRHSLCIKDKLYTINRCKQQMTKYLYFELPLQKHVSQMFHVHSHHRKRQQQQLSGAEAFKWYLKE